MNHAISARRLGKRYPGGDRSARGSYHTLRQALADACGRFMGRSSAAAAPGERREPPWALRDVSFDVRPGAIVGVVGRNGAGKSTLLKILARVTSPTEGEARLRGRLGSLLEVGTGFHPELTGRENIFLGGGLLGMSRAEVRRKFDAIVDFAGVEPQLHLPVKRFSSGMQLRLAFAVAAFLEPEILLVDEALAVGDAAFQRRCMERMRSLGGEGRTILLVSHQLGQLTNLCQRGLVIDQGQLVDDAPIGEAVAGYLRRLEAASEVDLSQRSDRTGAGEARVVRISIQGPGGPGSTPASGSSALFEVAWQGPSDGVRSVFVVHSAQGVPLFHCDSQLEAIEPPHCRDRKSSQTAARCEFGELLLIPGRYRLDVALFHGPTLQDRLEGAAWFDVEAGGRPDVVPPLIQGYGDVVLPHRWKRVVAEEPAAEEPMTSVR